MPRPRHPVLVIEDHQDTRGAIERLLNLDGYTVIAASDGQEALTYLKKDGRACLIVMDIQMPGMDGHHFRAQQLADPILARIPVVVFSGEKTNPLPGVAAFVRKSDPNGLLAFVAQHCVKDE